MRWARGRRRKGLFFSFCSLVSASTFGSTAPTARHHRAGRARGRYPKASGVCVSVWTEARVPRLSRAGAGRATAMYRAGYKFINDRLKNSGAPAVRWAGAQQQPTRWRAAPAQLGQAAHVDVCVTASPQEVQRSTPNNSRKLVFYSLLFFHIFI